MARFGIVSFLNDPAFLLSNPDPTQLYIELSDLSVLGSFQFRDLFRTLEH